MTLVRVVAVVSVALSVLGAQSCQIEYPSPPQTAGALWTELYNGWLDESSYIAWTFPMYEQVWVNVAFSGYKDRDSIRLWILVIPAEDFPRWKEGKPVRYVDWVNTDGNGVEPPGSYADVVAEDQMVLHSPVWGWGEYTIIVRNDWIFDFISGDTYVSVREWHR